jgi:Uma2 family endonuclease
MVASAARQNPNNVIFPAGVVMTQVLSQSRKKKPARRDPSSPLDGVQHIVLENASWELYDQLLREVGDRPIRINYDQGRLEMMSPLPEHEEVKTLIHDLIKALVGELNIEIKSLGSTTFRREDKAKGLEPDQCYYFKNERRMRGRKRLNLKKDPPPELVIEIDITHRSVDRETIYAGLGVPEIWRWDGTKLECLELTAGAYRLRTKSLAFPFLAPADLTRFIRMRSRTGENAILRKFRDWVRASGWVE